jgi:outer membrane protein assembly factor BamB
MADRGRYVMGAWDLVFDFDNVTAEAIPLRFVEQHVNVRRFLEEAPCFICLKLLNFSPQPDNTFLVDVQFVHPFPGLDNLTGFDVRGIAIFNGSYVFPTTGLRISDFALDDMELLNADGYTTLFNPVDFPEGSGKPIFTYSKGKAATLLVQPSTLNGYRVFYTDTERRMFRAGWVDSRTYHIARPAGSPIRVGYVVDACWEPPIHKPVVNPLTDFGPNANCYEAYDLVASVGSGLLPGCGSAPYTVDVYDHQGYSTVGQLIIESPDLFSGLITNSSGVDMGDFTRFTGYIPNQLKVGEGEYKVLFGVTDTVSDPMMGECTAYMITMALVEWAPVDWQDGWRKEGRDLSNTNFNPSESALGPSLSEKWTHQFPSGLFTNFDSLAIVSDGLVFVKADTQSEHKIYTFDALDGTPGWDVLIQPYYQPYLYRCMPLIANCSLYVGGSAVWSYDKTDQATLWTFSDGLVRFEYGSPGLDDGVLVIWGNNNYIYGLDALDGSKKWDYTTGEMSGNPGTPAVADGVVYAGDADGWAFALDLQTGDKFWKVQFPQGGPDNYRAVTAAVVLADGLVWVGSWNCHLYGLDPADGSIVWDVDLGDQLPYSAPAYDGNFLYQPLAQNGGGYPAPYRVIAVDPSDGSIDWEFPGTDTEGFFAQPAVANGYVWAVSDAGNLYCIDSASGAAAGPSYTLSGPSYYGPTIWNGMLYIVDSNGKVYAYEAG